MQLQVKGNFKVNFRRFPNLPGFNSGGFRTFHGKFLQVSSPSMVRSVRLFEAQLPENKLLSKNGPQKQRPLFPGCETVRPPNTLTVNSLREGNSRKHSPCDSGKPCYTVHALSDLAVSSGLPFTPASLPGTDFPPSPYKPGFPGNGPGFLGW
jgi:hypothetical protein